MRRINMYIFLLENSRRHKVDTEPKHLYSLEKLFHFRCYECDKWWTIGDFYYGGSGTKLYCPHCGVCAAVEECGKCVDIDNAIPFDEV